MCECHKLEESMKFNPFNKYSAFNDWYSIHYETVCMVIIDGSIDTDEIVQHSLYVLCQRGVLKDGDGFNFTKTSKMIIIGKALAEIRIDNSDSVN